MKVQVPPSLLNVSDKRLIIEAIYYVVRVLRNGIRNYPQTPVSTEPSPDARELAQRAVSEIEKYEKTKIPALREGRLIKYIDSLEDLLRSTYLSDVGADSDRAATILEEMRSSEELKAG